jgi:hypothetical protein
MLYNCQDSFRLCIKSLLFTVAVIIIMNCAGLSLFSCFFNPFGMTGPSSNSSGAPNLFAPVVCIPVHSSLFNHVCFRSVVYICCIQFDLYHFQLPVGIRNIFSMSVSIQDLVIPIKVVKNSFLLHLVFSVSRFINNAHASPPHFEISSAVIRCNLALVLVSICLLKFVLQTSVTLVLQQMNLCYKQL